MSTDARADIRGFILGKVPAAEFTDDENIFQKGLVTSLFAMELVLFIESHFGFGIPEDELKLQNFTSVDAMVGLVERQHATA